MHTRRKTVIMCHPSYYKIQAIENVHMRLDNQPHRPTAEKQWTLIHNLYEHYGYSVLLIDPVHFLHSMVFTANGGLIVEKGAGYNILLSNFLNATRQDEKTYYREFADTHSMEYFEVPQDEWNPHNTIFFEGQGDVVVTQNAYFLGYGIRSHLKSHTYVERMLNLKRPLISLRLINDKFYHLDTCKLSCYEKNAVVYYPEAFDNEGLKNIQSFDTEQYKVSERLALNFVCNSVALPDVIFLNIPFPYTEEEFQLSKKGVLLSEKDIRFKSIIEKEPEYENLIRWFWKLGYGVIPVYTSEYRKSGAGAQCLSLFTHKP